MDPRVSSTLLGILLFLIFSSEYAYTFVKKTVNLKGDMSLLARAVLFGIVLHFTSSML